MEEIKETLKSAMDIKEGRGLKATLIGVLAGFVAKRFTHDSAASLGAGLVAYSIVKRI